MGVGHRIAGHRTVPHTADLRIEAWAPTREECLAEAVGYLLERAVGGRVRDQRARREHDAGHPHPPVARQDEPVRGLLNDLH